MSKILKNSKTPPAAVWEYLRVETCYQLTYREGDARARAKLVEAILTDLPLDVVREREQAYAKRESSHERKGASQYQQRKLGRPVVSPSPVTPPLRTVLRDGRVLRAMARAGFIREPAEHLRPANKTWGQGYAYVEQGSRNHFQYQGRWYHVTYLKDCFMPFVIRTRVPAPVPRHAAVRL